MPSFILSDNGASSGSAGLKSIAGNDGVLAFQTSNVSGTATTAVTIDTSQNVGVGVTPSAWRDTTVAVQLGSYGSLFAYKNSGNVYLNNNSYTNSVGNEIYINTAPAGRYRISDNTHNWYNAASGTAGGTISWTQAMTLDASGNLGVGTTSPDVFGTGYERNVSAVGTGTTAAINVSGATASRIQLGVGSTRYGYIYQDASNFMQIATTTALPIVFNTNGSERARITSSGGLWVGTSTRYSTSNHIFVATTDGDWVANFQTNTGTVANAFGVLIRYNSVTPNNTGSLFFRMEDASANRAEFRSNGGLANFSANNANLSDERTKTDIQDAGGYLAKICAIPVRTFKYKDQTDDELNLGVIAQEVEAVAPELVDVSGFGETPEDGVPLKAIYQTDLQYALMKCIQEQQALITQLQADVEAMKGKA